MARSAKNAVTREAFDAIPTTAERTATYAPVSFSKMARICDEVVGSISDHYQSENASYYVNSTQDEMLIQHRLYKDGKDLGLSFEAMGSHNKQVANHFYGSNCVVWCNNGMMMADADVHWSGMHTPHKATEVEAAAWAVLNQWEATTEHAEEEMESMKSVEMDDNRFYEYTGLLYGHGVVKPQQLPRVHKEWHQPRHEAFAPRNMWSAYNAVTEIFKGAPITGHRERHTALSSLTAAF
jgi:hypothetical protein